MHFEYTKTRNEYLDCDCMFKLLCEAHMFGKIVLFTLIYKYIICQNNLFYLNFIESIYSQLGRHETFYFQVHANE